MVQLPDMMEKFNDEEFKFSGLCFSFSTADLARCLQLPMRVLVFVCSEELKVQPISGQGCGQLPFVTSQRADFMFANVFC